MANISKDDVNVRIGGTDATKDAVASAKRGMRGVGDESGTLAGRMQAHGAKMAAAFAKVAAVVYGLKKAFDFANEAARFEQSMAAFHSQVNKLGLSATSEFNRIRRASAGLIDDKSIVESANRALSLGIPLNEIGNLMEIARAKARDMGETTTQMFNDIVTGIGRGSPMILDNLGLMIKLGDVNEKYAASLGKTAKELTDVEKKQALLNAVMDAGTEAVNRHNLEQLTYAERIQQMTATLENLKLQIGAGLIRVVMGLQGALQWVTAGVMALVSGFMQLGKPVAWLSDLLGVSENALDSWSQKTESVITAAQDLTMKAADNFSMMSAKSEELMEAYSRVGEKSQEIATAQADAAAVTMQMHYDMAAEYRNLRMNDAMEWDAKMQEMADADNERERAKAAFRMQLASQTAQNLAAIAYSAYQLSDKQNKTAFKAYQAFAIAQTIIDTYKAAQGAYAALAPIPVVGPVLGAIAAAAAIAAGMARVKAIQSQKLGGGAAVAPSGAGASYSPTVPVRPAEGINAGQGEQARGPGKWEINVHGDHLDPDTLVTKITGAIEDAISDKRLKTADA
jgi:hypothetical protein